MSPSPAQLLTIRRSSPATGRGILNNLLNLGLSKAYTVRAPSPTRRRSGGASTARAMSRLRPRNKRKQ